MVREVRGPFYGGERNAGAKIQGDDTRTLREKVGEAYVALASEVQAAEDEVADEQAAHAAMMKALARKALRR